MERRRFTFRNGAEGHSKIFTVVLQILSANTVRGNTL